MSEYAIVAPILLLSFLICVMVTRFLVEFFPKMGLVDKPDNRRLHKDTTPTGGGLAVVVSFLLGFVLIDYKLYDFYYSCSVVVPIGILAAISFYDDIRDMPVFIRLVTYITVAGFITYELLPPYQLFHGELGFYADLILAIIALTGFCNIYNFMDGIDGITASESIHLSATIMILCWLRYDVIIHSDLVLLIAALILTCSIAFVIYNWHPAHIFIGDVGAISIGMLLGLCLMLIAASGAKLFLSTIIASMYYLADGGLTILIRLFKGEKIWLPHVNHFFQQAIRKGVPRKRIVIEVIICNYWLMLLAVSALYYPLLSFIMAIGLVTRQVLRFSEK
jgi:UDP-N-acetylmuramyl pentapeptide phosphotransferase/UDP-N-acetylglucosamine-1-phosphate transferase